MKTPLEQFYFYVILCAAILGIISTVVLLSGKSLKPFNDLKKKVDDLNEAINKLKDDMDAQIKSKDKIADEATDFKIWKVRMEEVKINRDKEINSINKEIEKNYDALIKIADIVHDLNAKIQKVAP